MLYTAALLSAAMLLAGCYSTDTDDDLLSTATLISIYPSTVSVGSAAATQNVVVTLAPKSKRNLDLFGPVRMGDRGPGKGPRRKHGNRL